MQHMGAKSETKALALFRQNKGVLRAREAVRLGIYSMTLNRLQNKGLIELISRGIYRLTGLEPLSHQDLVIISERVPGGVICLLSALAFHKMTTHNPREIFVAVPRGHLKTRIDWPPVHVFLFGDKAYSEGIETHILDGVSVKVYSREKTLVDCFKFRNRLGLDVFLEALKAYRGKSPIQVDKILYFAEICRVKRIIMPYIESIL